MPRSRQEELEIHLFVEAMRLRHGYDFSHYAKASLKRRVLGLKRIFHLEHLSELVPRLIWDEALLPQILANLSVPVSEMFRDPEVFLYLRHEVVPMLKSFPQIVVWQIGCATGEEIYSLAILLKEEGLYDRTRIFATDINDVALAQAEEGIFPAKKMQEYSKNYFKSGGRASLSDYYHADYDLVKMDESLKRNIMFTHHNVVSDGVFSEAHLILCRNVLIYFDRTLQNRVLKLMRDSLVRGGFLCLGSKETLELSDVARDFRALDAVKRIYRCSTTKKDA